MPVGPQGQKRPADTVGCAVKVCRIAVGDETEELDRDRPTKTLQARKGAYARAKSLSPERRAEIGREAAAVRWMKGDEDGGE